MRHVAVAGWTLEIPENHVERTRGLLGRTELDRTHALVLVRCRSVHTVGMRFPIDIVRLDADWALVGVRTLAPGRSARPGPPIPQIADTAADRGQQLCASLGGRTIRQALGPRTRRRST